MVTSFSYFQNRSYLSDVSTTTEDISVCGENYLIMPSGVKNVIYDTNTASSVVLKKISCAYHEKRN